MVQPISVSLGTLVAPVKTWSPERDAPDKYFEYIDLGAVDQEKKVIVGAREVLCAEAPSRAKQIVAAGDVLVSTVRPNLNGVARVPAEMDGATASTGFCVLRPHPGCLDSGYLFNWVRSPHFVAEMVRRATGASYPAVSDRIVLESHLPLPPVPEQRRIAAILDKVDTLRAKRRTALAQLDTLTQSIFLDIYFRDSDNPAVKEFVGEFQSAFGGAPSTLEAMGYDSIRFLGHALNGRKGTSGDEVRKAVSSMRGFRGVTGLRSFLPDREAQVEPYLLTVEGGQIKEYK